MAGRKKIKLRSFGLSNTNLIQNGTGIIACLNSVLHEDSTANSRRMMLNAQDGDEDLLSFYSFLRDRYLFGMMLRIIPVENGGFISDDLFSNNTISIADLEQGADNGFQYKDHYYFMLSDRFVVTNLSGSYSIDRFQTYINWLTENHRNSIFDMNPVTKLPDGVRVSDIKSIEFAGVRAVNVEPNSEPAVVTKMREITSDVLSMLFEDTEELDNIRGEELVSAKLLLKIRKRPADMAEEDYTRAMSAMTRQITNDSGIAIKTRQGGTYTGEAVKDVKEVDVELTENDRLNEQQLKQLMEQYLQDLESRDNHG
jgi:hypothetical protein|uniref:hypothetical protein n=1 Tax=Alloprevotella sp. TaxID=1872471 RepID=UPI002048BCCB|nr:MAG TPA: hypothetical protein [Caudoviricetes sp.]